MKKIIAATTALTLLTSSMTFADEAAPTMPVEIVSQDTVVTGAEGGILVPILTMIFLIMVSTGNSPASIVCRAC